MVAVVSCMVVVMALVTVPVVVIIMICTAGICNDVMIRSSRLWTQFKQLLKRSLKKTSGFNGIRTGDLCDTAAVLYQLSYEATSVGNRSILVGPPMPCELYNNYMICIAIICNDVMIRSSRLWMQFKQLRKRSLKKKF